MRLLTVDACISITGLLHPDTVQDRIKPVLMQMADDKSWRVRYMVADKLTEVQLSFN